MMVYVILLIVIVLAFLIFFGFYRFRGLVSKEKDVLFNQFGKTENAIDQADLSKLPLSMKNYLEKVGVIGKCKDSHLTFKQRGKVKTERGKKWTNFTATQYMTARFPNFLWSAQAFPMFIYDKSINGKGEVRVSMFGLKDVAKSSGEKTDKSALSRCLAELMFYPIGFLSDAISWETINTKAVKASVKVNGTSAEGIFYFNSDGLLCQFESKRYMSETLENFTGLAEDYKFMEGLFVPSKMKAVWNLEQGDFEYFNCVITDYRID